MPRKKTEVRVKRTEAVAFRVKKDGTLHEGCSICKEGCYHLMTVPLFPIDIPVTIIDRRELADIEARLKAAEEAVKHWKKLAMKNGNKVARLNNTHRPAAG